MGVIYPPAAVLCLPQLLYSFTLPHPTLSYPPSSTILICSISAPHRLLNASTSRPNVRAQSAHSSAEKPVLNLESRRCSRNVSSSVVHASFSASISSSSSSSSSPSSSSEMRISSIAGFPFFSAGKGSGVCKLWKSSGMRPRGSVGGGIIRRVRFGVWKRVVGWGFSWLVIIVSAVSSSSCLCRSFLVLSSRLWSSPLAPSSQMTLLLFSTLLGARCLGLGVALLFRKHRCAGNGAGLRLGVWMPRTS